jgi:hypothetical protein
MVKKFICQSFALLICLCTINNVNAQNSLLVNFGTNSCNASGVPAFSLIKNPFGSNPFALTTCDFSQQVPNIYGVFIAYNPKDNKIYLADIRTGNTKIWAIDMGLPANIACPGMLDSLPDHTFSYVSNNFEFDNNGDLWSFSNYNDTIGQCSIDKFDVNTGDVINTRLVYFPAGNFPTTISSSDVTILPNGRMFATLGSAPSRLYEILNYSSTTTNATANYLTTLPQNCFGIAYLNGLLEITGTDFSGNCYYYKYNISTNTLDSAVSFQDGQLPIDNTSITPSVGVTKQLVNAQKVNTNTVDITYEIYVKNLGNVALNNINVSDNLAAIYGAANVSNISVAFVQGDNVADLTLNPAYNGNNDSDLLLANQTLVNQTSANTNYFFKLRLSCRVTNLKPQIYENSAIGSATIGNIGNLSFINVSDSSNNGPQTAVDPNNNGNAGDPGENVPTPFDFITLPVRFISINASLVNKTSAMITWTIATPTVNSDKFEVDYSIDGNSWTNIGLIPIINTNQGEYQFLHNNIPAGNLFYRIKEIDKDGDYVYSSIALLRNQGNSESTVIFPNPANNVITISSPPNGAGKTKIVLCDAIGRQLISKIITNSTEELNTASFPDGTYVLTIENNGSLSTRKVVIMHH